MKLDYHSLVSLIYDCAANPELWPSTLSQIRDALRSEYVVIGFIDMSQFHAGKARWFRKNSPCDEHWLDRLQNLIPTIPFADTLSDLDVDISWTQLQYISEENFRDTSFYNEWVKPQSFRDTLNVKYLRRHHWLGTLGSPTNSSREPVTAEERLLAERLSPHIRRSILINELVDTGNLALTLYRQVIDSLSVAVFVIGLGRRMVFCNAAAESMLLLGDYVELCGGQLHTACDNRNGILLDEAIGRGLNGDESVGLAGIGVPIMNSDGDRVAAYVLPLVGKDVRGAMGAGHCAVFVAKRGEQQPMAMEILRTLFDLTVSEARVALLVAKGDGPQVIAEALGITVNTVRSHLKHCFAKTGTADQTGLSGAVNTLLPPVK